MEFMLVRASALPKFPQAFQAFVASCFAEKQVGEEKYFFAFRSTKFRSTTCKGFGSQGIRGQAPAHTLDISHFRDGLPKNQELGEWIQSYQKQNPTSSDIMSFYTTMPKNPADNFD